MNKIDALHSHLAPPSGTDDASPMLQPGDASAQLLPRHRYPYVTASRRSPVMSLNGAVACSQPLAAAAGYDILKMGGNAADAAVAVAAALNVTEPTSTGIGGDLFVLYFDAKTKQVKSLNGSGRAPKNLKLEDMQAKGYYQIPASDVNSATVPGAAAGWLDTLEMFGSHKVTPLQVLQPAIDLAENGYPVHPISAVMWQSAWDKLKGGKDDWLLDGKAPMAGQVISIPNLAKTFRLLATKGKDGFYKGEVAQAIVDVVKEFGGVMSLEDLASHTSTPNEPIFLDYKGIRVYEHGPNGQGIVALIALGILEQLEKSGKIPSPAEIPLNSAAYLHLLIEVLRFAFADAMQYVADPEFSKVPVKGLLSPEYLAERAKMFNPAKAAENVKYGELAAYGGDTVYFSVVDKDGNACSFINSVGSLDGYSLEHCLIPITSCLGLPLLRIRRRCARNRRHPPKPRFRLCHRPRTPQPS